MDNSAIADAVKQICDEKGISFDSVIETIEAALAAAYRKDFGEKNQNIEATFDIETGNIEVFDVKTVVEDVPEEELRAIQENEAAAEAARAEAKKEGKRMAKPEEPADDEEEEKKRFNPKTDIQISDAKKVQKGAKVDDVIRTQLEVPGDFGRMAAQTAKQVITQKLRETERATLYEEYHDKEGEIIVGTVQRREGRTVLVDLGRITAILPSDEQIDGESYIPGSNLKFYIVAVNSTTKGPEILLSRSHPAIVEKLFTLEIPEIANGTVEIKGVSREAGSRSKVAVYTEEENIDPIGSCIGQRGARIQTIISELKGEKVDIVKWSEDPKEFLANALSPAKIDSIELDEETRQATAKVDESQLSLAIGKSGQNVRLAAKLTGWKIDVISDGKSAEEIEAEMTDEEGETPTEETPAETEAETPAEEEKVEESTEETTEETSTDEEASDEQDKK